MATFELDLRQRDVLLQPVNESDWVGVDTRGPAGKVLIRLGTSPEGRLVCTGLVVGAVPDPEAGELTARQLRAIPLGQIIAWFAAWASESREAPDEAGLGYMVHPDPDDVARGAEARPYRTLEGLLGGMILGRTEPYKGPQARPGPKGHPPEHYERVAAAYRQALISHPQAPMKALAEQLHASDATVRRWVQRARDKGLLGPSVPGKAGETAT